MICSYCGLENQDGCRFCANCGKEMEAVVSAPVAEEAQESSLSDEAKTALETEEFFEFDVNDRVPGVFVQNESVYESLENQARIAHGGTEISFDQGTKRKIMLIALIAVVAVIVLGALGYLFYPKIAMGVVDPISYYAVAESKAMKESFSDYGAIMDNMKKRPYSAVTDGKIIISEVTGMTAQQLAAFNQFSFKNTLESDLEKGKLKNQASMLYNGTSFAEILTKQASGKISVSYPGISDNEMITSSADWYTDILNGNETETLACTGLKSSEFKKLQKELAEKVILASVPDANIIKSKAEYQGVKCTTVTFTIDQTVINNIINALATELESNQQLREVVFKSSQYFSAKMLDMDKSITGTVKIPTKEEVEEGITSFVKELRATDTASLMGQSVQYKVYYNGRGSLVARDLAVAGVTAMLGTYEKDKSIITEFIVKTPDGQSISAIDTKTVKGKNVEGAIIVDTGMEEMDLCQIKYNYEKNAKINGVYTTVGRMELQVKGKTGSSYSEYTLSLENQRDTDTATRLLVKLNINLAGQKIDAYVLGKTEYNKNVNLDSMGIADQSTLTVADQEEIMNQIVENWAKTAMGVGA